MSFKFKWSGNFALHNIRGLVQAFEVLNIHNSYLHREVLIISQRVTKSSLGDELWGLEPLWLLLRPLSRRSLSRAHHLSYSPPKRLQEERRLWKVAGCQLTKLLRDNRYLRMVNLWAWRKILISPSIKTSTWLVSPARSLARFFFALAFHRTSCSLWWCLEYAFQVSMMEAGLTCKGQSWRE